MSESIDDIIANIHFHINNGDGISNITTILVDDYNDLSHYNIKIDKIPFDTIKTVFAKLSLWSSHPHTVTHLSDRQGFYIGLEVNDDEFGKIRLETNIHAHIILTWDDNEICISRDPVQDQLAILHRYVRHLHGEINRLKHPNGFN